MKWKKRLEPSDGVTKGSKLSSKEEMPSLMFVLRSSFKQGKRESRLLFLFFFPFGGGLRCDASH